jgi:hypothetical protein
MDYPGTADKTTEMFSAGWRSRNKLASNEAVIRLYARATTCCSKGGNQEIG